MGMLEPASFSFSLDEESARRFISGRPHIEETPLSYVYRGNGYTMTLFKKVHGDGTRKLLIQGRNAEEAAAAYSSFPSSKAGKAKGENLYPQIGSDEVGTGDFFGPIVVVAAYVEEKDLPFLSTIGIGDSKQFLDEEILAKVPLLLGKIPYSELSLPPERLNELPYNLNEIKARMHDQAYRHLLKKVKPKAIYQDQFAPEKTYYRYLSEVEGAVKGVVFETKGESKHPSVALASFIARYAFLRKMEAMGKEYGVDFPLGASSEVEAFARRFYRKKGLEALRKTAKERFVTFSRVISRALP